MQIAGMVVNRAGSEEQKKQYNMEAKAYKKEANLVTEEGLAEVERMREEGSDFEAKQRLSYLKSGVSLRGSPLLVLADTREETSKQADAYTRRTFAQRSKLRAEAGKSRSKGRSAVINATSQNLKTAGSMMGGGA